MKIERKYLPSKKFVAALSSAIMLVLIAVALGYSTKGVKGYKNDNGLVVDSSATSSWLENGNQIDPSILAVDQKAQEEYESLNPTDKIARGLISNIIATQPTNGDMDQATIDALVAKAIQEIPNKQYSGITKESDLNIVMVDENTLGKYLLTYKNSFFTVTEDLRAFLGADLKTINDGMKSGEIDKTALSNIISKYQTVINKLIKMPLPAVPGSLVEGYYLAIINDLEKITAIDNDIINVKNDSASAFADLVLYNNVLNDLTNSLAQIDVILKIVRV